jgi:hypothetical protein
MNIHIHAQYETAIIVSGPVSFPDVTILVYVIQYNKIKPVRRRRRGGRRGFPLISF